MNTELEEELATVLKELVDTITNIRGIDIEFYAPNQIEQAYAVLNKVKVNEKWVCGLLSAGS